MLWVGWPRRLASSWTSVTMRAPSSGRPARMNASTPYWRRLSGVTRTAGWMFMVTHGNTAAAWGQPSAERRTSPRLPRGRPSAFWAFTRPSPTGEGLQTTGVVNSASPYHWGRNDGRAAGDGANGGAEPGAGRGGGEAGAADAGADRGGDWGHGGGGAGAGGGAGGDGARPAADERGV